VFDHITVPPRGAVSRGQSRLTAAFERIQDFADERRRTAACVDILEVAEERQKILVSRHVYSSVLVCCRWTRCTLSREVYGEGVGQAAFVR
jgi:hypothetical protein